MFSVLLQELFRARVLIFARLILFHSILFPFIVGGFFSLSLLYIFLWSNGITFGLAELFVSGNSRKLETI